MIEHSVHLGPDSRLLGIVSEPDAEAARDSAPTTLLLNAGLVHRVGPNRLNVNIGRDLASRGFKSARFDMSGIGDSNRPADEMPYVEQSVADVVDAMDSFSAMHGDERFVIIGLCTGAYNALEAAVADDRVVGAVLIDGYAYPTMRFTVTHQTKRLLQGWRWARFIKRKLGLLEIAKKKQPDDMLVFEPEDLTKAEFDDRIVGLTRRGVHVHFVYTGFGPQSYNYEGQLFDAFPHFDRELVTVKFIPGATHTFTLPTHRDEVVQSIADWFTTSFGSGEPATHGAGGS